MNKMNKVKLKQEVFASKLTRISFIAFLGVAFTIPCIKTRNNENRALLPIQNKIDLNYKVSDDEAINTGIIVNSVSYVSSTGYYRCDYAIPLEVLLPYNAYANMHFFFNYINDNELQMVSNYFDFVDTSIETFGTSQMFSNASQFYIQGNYVSSQSDYVFKLTGQVPNTYTFVNNELLDGSEYGMLTAASQPGKTIGINVFPLRLVDDATRTYRQGYNDGTDNGINYVLTHLREYNLYTEQEYYAYGQSEYDRGFNTSTEILSIGGLAREIFKSPITMFQGIFNWSLVLPNGETINVLPIMTFLLTIGIALAVIRLITRLG